MTTPSNGNVQATREPQYERLLELDRLQGRVRLGLMMNQAWIDDPKRLAFTFSRYKFVARMLAGRNRVLEIGCGDGFPSRIVAQAVKSLVISDFDPVLLADARDGGFDSLAPEVVEHDILSGPLSERFDAIYSLDVLEHIEPVRECDFMRNLLASLSTTGAAIIGMPSLESQHWASPLSREGHVNCKSGDHFKVFLQEYFHNVFVFSMNDEVVHTGFYPMAHYLMALCTQPKSDDSVRLAE